MSLIWVYMILNVSQFSFLSEKVFFNIQFETSLQLTIIYILGSLISICYISLIFYKIDKD